MADLPLHHVIIVQRTTHQILLLSDHERWKLPTCSHERIADILQEIEQVYHLKTIMLGCVDERVEGDTLHLIFALEEPGLSPPSVPGGKWIDSAQLADYSLTPIVHQQVIRRWLQSQQQPEDGWHALPWYRSGWLAEATVWIEEKLMLAGLHIEGEIEQFKLQLWACVLRVMTNAGLVYFKATAPACTFEPLLVYRLFQLWPDLVPGVIAYDRYHRWLLMHDSGKNLGVRMLMENDTAPHYDVLLPVFARMQKEALGHLPLLVATGFPSYGFDKVPGLLETVLQDPVIMQAAKDDWSAEDYQQIQQYIPQVRQLCEQITELGIPFTLHHDDLWCGNVLYQHDQYRFLDWGESAYAHPFCSLYTLFKHARFFLHYDDQACRRLRDIYLSCWTDFAPLNQLIEGFELTQRLALLYRCFSWHRIVRDLPETLAWRYISEVTSYLHAFVFGEE